MGRGHGHGGGHASHGRSRGRRGRRHHSSSHGGGGGGGGQCVPESFKIPTIIMAVVSLLVAIVFAVLFIVLPLYTWDPHDDVSITREEQPQLSLHAPVWLSTDKATVYEYDYVDVWYDLGIEVRNFTFERSESLKPDDLIVINASGPRGKENITIHFDVHFSSPGDLILLNSNYLAEFLANHVDPYYGTLLHVKNVTDYNLTYHNDKVFLSSPDVSLIFWNNGNADLTFNAKGWMEKPFLKMDEQKALSVCYPGQECLMDGILCVYVFDYLGEGSASVSIREHYEFNIDMEIAIDIVAPWLGVALATTFAFLIVWCFCKCPEPPPNDQTSDGCVTKDAASTNAATDSNLRKSLLDGGTEGAPPDYVTPEGTDTLPYVPQTDIFGLPSYSS